MRQLILASNSPRRREILKGLYHEFTVVSPRFEERAEGLSPGELVACFSRGKAREVLSRYPHALVLGADTVVSLGGKIYGKPADEGDACRMLGELSGKVHAVFTGYCFAWDGGERCGVERSEVRFLTLSERAVREYVAQGSPLDKAGAYGIQDGAVVADYQGSYTNIVGLPEKRIGEMIAYFQSEGIL